MAILPLADFRFRKHPGVMTVLLILLALWVLIAVAQWRGWTADTRDGLDWAPRLEAERRRLYT
jgi:hypothetical protein